MDQFLYWYSQNNKIIIQVLAVLIGILLISLMYRIFFGAGDAPEESMASAKPQHFDEIDKKISGVMTALENLQQQSPAQPAQKSRFATEEPEPKIEPILAAEETIVTADEVKPEGATSGSLGTSVDIVLIEENEKLKNELSAVKSNLKSKDKEISEVKEQLEAQKKLVEKGAKAPTRVMIDTASLNGDKDLISKIDELQKKLAEYDIIADDISELQTLRKENAELKGGVTPTAEAEAATEKPEGT